MVDGALFITGTDTEVGKTFVACALLQALMNAGNSVFALKPVAAGAEEINGQWQNDDALALQHHASFKLDYDLINPCLLKTPIAPHLAAAQEGQSIRVDTLVSHCRHILTSQTGFALIEGAGGWRVPVNDQEYLSDLAIRLQLPVIMVVPIRLGCLNHALLTAEAVRHDGLPLAGWVANQIQPDYTPTNALIDTLNQRLAAPCLGRIPLFKEAAANPGLESSRISFITQAAAQISIEPLLKAFASWKISIKVN